MKFALCAILIFLSGCKTFDLSDYKAANPLKRGVIWVWAWAEHVFSGYNEPIYCKTIKKEFTGFAEIEETWRAEPAYFYCGTDEGLTDDCQKKRDRIWQSLSGCYSLLEKISSVKKT